MIGRALGLVVAALMIVGGGALTLQSLGYLGSGARSSNSGSAILGPLLAGLGVALVIVIIQGARRR